MTKILNIGMNHETAPIELRECLAAEPDNAIKALNSIRDLESIREGLFLSTCNRIEALVVAEIPEKAEASVIALLSGLGNIPEKHLLASLYSFEDMDAVLHIFRLEATLKM